MTNNKTLFKLDSGKEPTFWLARISILVLRLVQQIRRDACITSEQLEANKTGEIIQESLIEKVVLTHFKERVRFRSKHLSIALVLLSRIKTTDEICFEVRDKISSATSIIEKK